MKLEVGKSYRTRDGKKVTISVNRDNNSISYPFAGDNNVDYTEDGRFWEHPTKDRQDIIAEWEDEKPAKKYREGDLVTVKLDRADADWLNSEDDEVSVWNTLRNQIVSHEPAPFDWSTVKAGMAFKGKDSGHITWYVRPRTKDSYVLATVKDREKWTTNNLGWNEYSDVVRSPEHDIEV